MACDFLFASGVHLGCDTGLSFAEFRAIAKAEKNKRQIQKGERYTKQYNKNDGEAYTFRAITDIHKICLVHDLYSE